METEMSEAKLDLILEKLSSLEGDVQALKGDVQALKGDVQALKGDVQALKGSVASLDTRVERLEAKQDETLEAFRAHYGDMANLYRHVRDDLARFELRVEGKLSQVNQSIVALKDSIDRQDFRSDELGRRIARLEEQPRHPI